MGSRIKELRLAKKYSQEKLGSIVNVTKVSISCYESGNRFPDLETFEALVDALDTTPDYLLGRDKKVISEEDEKYKIYLPKEDLNIINQIYRNPDLLKFLREDPKRSVELIVKKVNK